MSLLLTRDDLVALTGTKQPARMTAWLTARAWVFEPPSRRGEVPKVDRVSTFVGATSGAYQMAAESG